MRTGTDRVLTTHTGSLPRPTSGDVAANPPHEHEWTVFDEVTVPDDIVLIPGVIDSTRNYVEHPELVAQLIERYAEIVGRERVIAGTDCGFGTFAGFGAVHRDSCWAKLRARGEGAALASRKLWASSARA